MSYSNLAVTFVALHLITFVAGCSPSGKQPSAEKTSADQARWLAGPNDKLVQVVIDYGDGMEKHFTRLPWKPELTAFSALNIAKLHPRGIALESRGSGEAAMVTAIDDMANEAGKEDGRNWIYRVNGKLPSKSSDVYTLAPDDVILWKFEKFACKKSPDAEND